MAAQGYVLVVDDDASIRWLTVEVLKEAGYEARAAENGKAALDIVSEAVPQLVVLDLQMPVMDGRTFFRELRGAGYSMPVVLLSAYGARQAMLELGAEAAVNKPFDIDDLIGHVSLLVTPHTCS